MCSLYDFEHGEDVEDGQYDPETNTAEVLPTCYGAVSFHGDDEDSKYVSLELYELKLNQ